MKTELTVAQQSALVLEAKANKYMLDITNRIQELLSAQEESPNSWGYTGEIGNIMLALQKLARNKC